MIEIAALSKRYGAFTAVRSLDLVVPGGELFGFLGPNGAGKTTTMRMIAGILQPTAGTVRIAGHDLRRDPLKAKRTDLRAENAGATVTPQPRPESAYLT